MKTHKIVLTTLPVECEFVNWTTPKYFTPTKINKYMPLGILSLASNLPPNYDVVILDASSEPWTIEETIRKIEEQKPDVLGISATTRRIYALNKILKGTSAKYKVVGGPHATYYSDLTLNAGADAVFVGPLADLEFSQALESRPKGVIHCKTEINQIKFPDRMLLDVNRYFPKESLLFKAINRLPMFSSIGCPNKCFFCNVQSKTVQYKNPEAVVDEMEYLVSLGSKSVHVLDDNFNVNSRHLEGIISELEKRNIHTEWSGRGQTKMNFDLTARLRATGFKRINVGIEALDDSILTFLNKNETVADVHKFCYHMNKNGIDILSYFILGTPVETGTYLKNLPVKIEELGIKHVFLNMLFPEPNTLYYESLLKGRFYSRDLWKEFMLNPTPYYEIPYPYGETKKQEIISYTNELIQYFNKQ
ncbi:MAG: radical SAM protein [Kiritimatiellae bacterium]|nr:radical SAM protein [Kiritimatiellia bacterium]